MTRILRARKTHPVPTDNAASDSGEEEAPEPTRKRAKRTKPEDKDYDYVHGKAQQPLASSSSLVPATGRIRRGRVGKLAQLPNMPLDVLHEIFASLHPLDLLRLTRTTKTLRGHLMSRGSRHIWIAALATVPGCPPAPEGMTEPAWVRLAFEHTCHACDTKNAKHVLWAARVRTCIKCIGDHTDLISYGDACGDPFDVMSMHALVSWEHGVGKHRWERFTRRDDLQVLRNTLKALPLDSTEREDFVNACQKKAKAREQHAKECVEWEAQNINKRFSDLSAARERRKEAIQARLVDMDPEYEKDLAWLPTLSMQCWQYNEKFENLKSVKQAKDLTDRMWTNCKAEIVSFMEPVRTLRLADEWLHVLKRRVTLFSDLVVERCPSDIIPPCVMNLYTRLDIRAILERSLDDDGRDTVNEATFTDILTDFHALLVYARAERTATLLAAIETGSKTPGVVTEAHFDRATSIFRCNSQGCTVVGINSATALVHRCDLHHYGNLPNGGRFGLTQWEMTEPLDRMRYICAIVPSSGGQTTIGLDLSAIGRAKRIMNLVGIDPAQGTMADLDSRDPWISCSCQYCALVRGSTGFYSSKSVMDWRHLVNRYHSERTDLWTELNEEERALAIVEHNAFKPTLDISPRSVDAIWSCGHCAMSPLSIMALKQHVRDIHNVEGDLQLDVDYKSSPHCLTPLAGFYSIKLKTHNQSTSPSTATPSDA